MSSTIDLQDVSHRIAANEPTTALELRAWLANKLPHELGEPGSPRRDASLAVVRNRHLDAIVRGGKVLSDAGLTADRAAELKADQARQYNRCLAEAGELALLMNEFFGDIARHDQIRAERNSPERKRQIFAALNDTGGDAARREDRLWLPTLPQYRRLEVEGKAATIGSDPGGGYLVETPLGPFVDRLRPASVVLQAGPRVIPMTTQAMNLPRLGTSATVYAVGEAGSMTESSPQYQLVRLSAQKYVAHSVGSREWFDDSTEGLSILQLDQERQLGAMVDVECLQGTGAGASPILGMRNMPGVVQTAVAADAGNGGIVALADFLDAIDRLGRQNASPSAIFMHPRTWATCRKLADTQQRLQLTPNPADAAARQLFGLPVFLSSQISITETKGANSDCSYILVADMTQVVVGMRQQAAVLMDPYSLAANGQVRVITTVRVAFNLLATEGVQVIKNVRTV